MSLGFWKRKTHYLDVSIFSLSSMFGSALHTPPQNTTIINVDDDDDDDQSGKTASSSGKKIHHHQQQHQEQQHLCVLEECWQRPKLRDETKIILDGVIVVIAARGVFFLSSKNGSDDGRVRRGELRRFLKPRSTRCIRTSSTCRCRTTAREIG